MLKSLEQSIILSRKIVTHYGTFGIGPSTEFDMLKYLNVCLT